MTLIELIGFIITMVAFFLLVAKQARDERKRRENPEAYEEELEQQQEAVKDLLRSLNIKVPEERPAPPAPPPPIPPHVEMEGEPPISLGESKVPQSMRIAKFDYGDVFRDPYADRRVFEHGDAYLKRKHQQSRVKKLLRETDSIKDAVVLKEVLGPPKGLE